MPNSTTTHEPTLYDTMDRLIEQAGGDPSQLRGKLVREMLHTAIKLVRDQANEGEAKLLSRSLKELRYALKVFRDYQGTPKVTIFGSARTQEEEPAYGAAATFAGLMATSGWMVITGAGDGIMRAGHGGAGTEASFGVSIRLPFETSANDFIVGDPKLVTFRYFFTRKLVFMWMSSAVVLFPGGFGTQDECFEALTLIQTGKAPMMPIVMVDAPGQRYWKRWDEYIRSELLTGGMINAEDLNLYHVTDSPEDAAAHVRGFYRNYHSQRYVQDDLVLRLNRRLTPDQIDQLNHRFNDLIEEGAIHQGGPFEVEREHLDLPRLWFHYTRRDYGRLRQLIDQINAYDRENADK